MSFIYPVDKRGVEHSNNFNADRSVYGLSIHYGLDFRVNLNKGDNIYSVDDGRLDFQFKGVPYGCKSR